MLNQPRTLNSGLLLNVYTTIDYISQSTDKYEYPIISDIPGWKNLSVAEKNKMLQIPEDKLKSIPTEVLIQAYLDNPFCSLMFAYNTAQDGFHRVYREFNGLRELMKRSDAAVKLVDFYKTMQVDGYDVNWEPIRKGRFTFQFVYIERLISQPEIIAQLNMDDVKILINELEKKYDKKIEHVSEHSIVDLESCAYTIAHTLNQNGKLSPQGASVDEAMKSFLETGRLSQSNMLDQILQKARVFVQN
jgi:hypothetical protein